MKTSSDPRHQHRRMLMDKLFAYSFRKDVTDPDIAPLLPSLPDVDARIISCAPEWPIDKIAKIDLAILRLAVYELTVEKKQPPKVIIDEAVELGKEFGNEHSSQFINGVLGSILKQL